MSASKAKSKSEQWWLDKVAHLGCLACRLDGNEGVPAVIHHIREGQGTSQRAPHQLVIPLCPEHHVGGFSVHGSYRQFTAIYGSEMNLVALTIDLVVKEIM